ncbi:MAG TPA: hypothetical protein VJR69_06875 [Nitrospira sp.]|nr:hypothetical protein [Nitrospira sp.]
MPAASHDRRTGTNGIQIDEDLRFQARIWRIERIGWWGIAAILAAAIAGLFGRGPISRTTAPLADPAHPGGGMLLDYERFGRAHSDSQFVLSGPARPPAGGNFFSLDFLLVIFRLAGRRTLAQMTNFDFVLLLIISEATQNAMIGEDDSVTNGALVVRHWWGWMCSCRT